MKPKKFKSKLSLKKVTIANLVRNEMVEIVGGADPTTFAPACQTCMDIWCRSQPTFSYDGRYTCEAFGCQQSDYYCSYDTI